MRVSRTVLREHCGEVPLCYSTLHPRQPFTELVKHMKKAHSHYTVSELCQVLDVASSSYYYQAQAPSLADIELITQIKCIAKETGNTYGKRKMQVALASLGHDIGLYRFASLMKKADVLAIRPMRKHYYPDAGMEQHMHLIY